VYFIARQKQAGNKVQGALMPEMAHPGKDHCHTVLIRSRNHFFITH
jgi:hypothetical protein